MSKELEKISDINEWYKICEEGEDKWAKQAKEDKDFYWSRQWDASDKAKLLEEGRPCLTFNEIKPAVNLVSGTERQNRQDLKVFNRTGGNEQIAQLLTMIVKDVEDQSNSPFNYSRTFLDGLITGKGYIGLGIEYDKDILNGDIVLKRLPPFRVKVDPSSEEYDLSDAEYIFQEGWFTKKRLKLIYPEKAAELDLMSVKADDKQLITATLKGDDYGSVSGEKGKITDINKYKLRVKTCWYKTYENVTFLFNEQTGGLIPTDLTKERLREWIEFQAMAGTIWRIIENVVQPVLHLAVVAGNVLLQDIEKPLEEVNKFPIVPYYAYWMDDECSGMVTDLKDPQREVNKRYSQVLHHLNRSANSGWQMEEGSVRDKDQYKKFGSAGGTILEWIRGRTPPKQIDPTPLSQGHLLLGDKGSDKIKKISGVNIDLLGQVGERGEPGIVLQLRQKQGSMVIEQLYDNWRYTRKLIGQLLIDVIQKARTYTAEEIVNIVGREKAQMPGIVENIERIMNDLNVGRYEAAVDMTTSTPTVKMANFSTLMEAAKAGLPIPPDVLIEAHPDLPNKEEILKRMRQEQQMSQTERMTKLEGLETGAPRPRARQEEI